jgi:hypothetical protein
VGHVTDLLATGENSTRMYWVGSKRELSQWVNRGEITTGIAVWSGPIVKFVD